MDPIELILFFFSDLGEYLRNQFKERLRTENVSTAELTRLNNQCDSLTRLANNFHFNKFKRTRNSTATGLTVETCNLLLSDTALKYLTEESKKNSFTRYRSDFKNFLGKKSD